jgi:hypothetical protein
MWLCNDGWIHDSLFTDNTDVDIAIGGGSGFVVEDNDISNDDAHAFAGMHIGHFLGGDGGHTDNVYQYNTITSQNAGLGVSAAFA